MKSYIITSLFVLLVSTFLYSQVPKQAIAILDLSARNAETNDARMFSIEHICKVAGIPFIMTTDLAEAEEYAMIFCSSAIKESTLTEGEETQLYTFVENGGLLLAPRVEEENLYELFGVEGFESDFSRYTFTWDKTDPYNEPPLRWINEPEEITVSLGRDTYESIYKTLGYNPTTATSLAHFTDGTSAVTSNTYGQGRAVAIGLSLKEVVLRNQINRDYEAQRISSNGFEPTLDAFILFVRALFVAHQPHAVWKHTSPGNTTATVMITHDIDSRTAMDTLRGFVDYEKAKNIVATYNITCRYFDDELMSDFYIDQQETMDYIKNNGQAFGSHSVGHFFDFADEDIFPIGEPGNTRDNYNPHNDGDFTLGGTIYGETEVSKDVILEDIGVTVNTFRSGHLAYPKYLVNVLEELDYEYNSSFSAADVLTNFPYQNKMGRSFSGERSSVYELPVTISDVFHANPISSNNYLNKSDIWLDVVTKNSANGAPSVLLIHPNRNYKLDGMKYFVENLPDDIYYEEMSKFGDYWKAREQLDFATEKVNNVLTITLPEDVDLEDNVSFIVSNGQNLDAVVVKNAQQNVVPFHMDNWNDTDLIVYYANAITSGTNNPTASFAKLSAYPNPASKVLNIAIELEKAGDLQLDLLNAEGSKVVSLLQKRMGAGTHQFVKNLEEVGLAPGIYFLAGRSSGGGMFKQKILLL
ncbi:MAG: T9SS type A sorting domain-containing protein [Saprospiraceae bacterium]